MNKFKVWAIALAIVILGSGILYALPDRAGLNDYSMENAIKRAIIGWPKLHQMGINATAADSTLLYAPTWTIHHVEFKSRVYQNYAAPVLCRLYYRGDSTDIWWPADTSGWSIQYADTAAWSPFSVDLNGALPPCIADSILLDMDSCGGAWDVLVAGD